MHLQGLPGVRLLAVKFKKELRHVPYEETLHRLWFLSLARRRICNDLIYMVEIAHSLPDFPWDAAFAASLGLEVLLSRFTKKRCYTR